MRVGIVIVNWNTGDLLSRCIESICKLPEKDCVACVVIVDNASKDNSMMRVREFAHVLDIAFLPQKKNLGFSKACNVGISYVRSQIGASVHILLLNPDTEIQRGALSTMAGVLDDRPDAGIVGPKLIDTNGHVQVSVRTFPSLTVLVFLMLKLHRLFSSSALWKTYMMTNFSYNKSANVDQIMGAVFLIRSEVIDRIGLLDESYWIWFEEVDYCLRAHNAGWNVVFTPEATVLHHGGASFSQRIGVSKSFPFIKSCLTFARIHMGIHAFLVLLFVFPIALFLSVLSIPFHLKSRTLAHKVMKLQQMQKHSVGKYDV